MNKKTILCIDDDELFCKIVKEYLMDVGYSVVTTVEGDEGLKIFHDQKPDTVLLDLRMPGIDGLEVLKEMTETRPDTPVIIVSGQGAVIDVIKALRLGAWDYITKPIEDVEILDVSITKCLERAEIIIENKRYKEGLENLVQKRTEKLITAQEELHKNEEQIKKHNVNLQDAVKVAEGKLEVLLEEQFRLEKLAAIGQIYSNVSHEIRNPLGAIKQSVFFLKRKMKSYPNIVQEHLNLMDEQLNRANDVIKKMLYKMNGATINREITDLREIINEALRQSKVKEGITVQITSKPEKFMVSVDPLLIRQVFINLLTNASQAITDTGNIDISCIMISDNKCQIEIRDTGHGIDTEIKDKIFIPLFTTKPQGVGLGLGICRQIIDIHGGSIKIESRAGTGTTIIFNLDI